jgi:transglutaminase-like putative cysteine protease
MEDLSGYLRPGRYVDSDAPAVVEFARRSCGEETDEVSRAVSLYNAVRDTIIYTPYFDFQSEDTYRASTCLIRGSGFCVAKAALLAAAARVVGIPARVGYADVRNHLCTRRLRSLMGTDIFYYHSYAELLLRGKWVKATPAFDRGLCERFRVRTLEFDGVEDSLMHPYNDRGRRHMEYLRHRGAAADVPVREIMELFAREYPGFGPEEAAASATRFREEAEKSQALKKSQAFKGKRVSDERVSDRPARRRLSRD